MCVRILTYRISPLISRLLSSNAYVLRLGEITVSVERDLTPPLPYARYGTIEVTHRICANKFAYLVRHESCVSVCIMALAVAR